MLEPRSLGGQAAIVSHHHKFQENVVCFGEKYRKSRAGQCGWNTGYTILTLDKNQTFLSFSVLVCNNIYMTELT